MTRVFRVLDFSFIVVLAWASASALPVSAFWYAPGDLRVIQGRNGPEIVFDRHIKRLVVMSYSVVIRDVDTLAVVCEASGGPFEYQPQSGILDAKGLDWWAPGDPRCSNLPTGGVYILKTCWTAADRFFGLLLPRSICRASNPFED